MKKQFPISLRNPKFWYVSAFVFLVPLSDIWGQESDKPELRDVGFAELTGPDSETAYFVNEAIPIDCKVFVEGKGALREISNCSLESKAVQLVPFKKLTNGETVRDEKTFATATLSSVIYGTAPGEHKVDSGHFRLRVVDDQASEKFKLFTRTLTGRAPIKEFIVKVKPFPTPPPASFTGGVGKFEATFSFEAVNPIVGKPIYVKTLVSGTGNFQSMEAPQVEGVDLTKWEVFDAIKDIRVDTNTAEPKATVFIQKLVPKVAGSLRFPAFSFACFDPETERFTEFNSQPKFWEVSEINPKNWSRRGKNNQNHFNPTVNELSFDFNGGQLVDGTKRVINAKGAKWVAPLKSANFGEHLSLSIHEGRIFVGTNNWAPDAKEDHGVLRCLDQETGEMIWQLAIPRLDVGKVSDWEGFSLASTPTMDGKHGFVLTNRGELICFDTMGMADGNDGPFLDEAKYATGGLSGIESGKAESAPIGPRDADIIWGYDLRLELGVFPHNITSGAPLLIGNQIIVPTPNGVTWTHVDLPSPYSPALISIDRETGKLLSEDAGGICEDTLHANWSSPVMGVFHGVETIVHGAGDGFLHGIHPHRVELEIDGDDVYPLMKQLWKVDVNPKEYRKDEEGTEYPHKRDDFGPSEIIATPVIHGGRIFAALGREVGFPSIRESKGCLVCVEPGKKSWETRVVWRNTDISHATGSPVIVDGILYIGDIDGGTYGIDAATGKTLWTNQRGAGVYTTPLVLDGKVLVGNQSGELLVFDQGKEAKGKIIEFPSSIESNVVLSGTTIYVRTSDHLYAFDLARTGTARDLNLPGF